MKNLNFFYGIIIIISTFSCNPKNEDLKQEENKNNVEVSNCMVIPPPSLHSSKFKEQNILYCIADASSSEKIQSHPIVNKKKIIKNGRISIKSLDIVSSKKNIDSVLKKFNSYYDSEVFQNDDKTISYDLTLRIPADNFEKVIVAFESGKDEIISKSVHSVDVTEEYIDTEARLNNKRGYLKRYKDLLTKALTVKEILAIEENIRPLQEEIESTEGRLKYLNDQVAYSTLDISLFKNKTPVSKPNPEDKFTERVKKSISNGWNSVVDFTLLTISTWPLIILIIVLFFIIRQVVKRHKRKQVK